MKNLKSLLPIVVFVFAIVISLGSVIISNKIVQEKTKISSKAAGLPGFGELPPECPGCPDPSDKPGNFCTSPCSCTVCNPSSDCWGKKVCETNEDCDCPTQPPRTPTPTVPVTNTPTPTTPVNTPTPTPTTPVNTPTPTTPVNTPTPTPTTPVNTPTPTTPVNTPTPVPVGCGTKGCDNTTNPCRSGLTCVQANDSSNYCSLPEYTNACKENPSVASCCSPPGNTPTPTQIILTSVTPTKPLPTVPQAGGIAKPWLLIPLGIVLLGLFL